MKTCAKCGVAKELAEFNRRMKRHKLVFRSRCRECERAEYKTWSILNAADLHEHKRTFKRANREQFNFYERRRKYLLRCPNPQGSHTFEEWLALKAAHGCKCLRCGKGEPIVRLTGDHIIPLSTGGTDGIENIQPLCYRCNQVKNSKAISYLEAV